MTDPSRKPKRIKTVFALVVLLAGILVLASFYFFNYPKENHADLLPVNSIMYVTANQGNIFSLAKLNQLPLDNFFTQVEKQFDFKGLSFKNEILKDVAVASFAILPADNNLVDFVLVLRLKAALPFMPVSEQTNKVAKALLDQKNSLKVKDSIIIATSPKALQAINDVMSGKTFALSGQLKQFPRRFDFLMLYLNSQALAAQFKDNNLAEKFFGASVKESVYLTLNRGLRGLKFKINGNDFSLPKQANLQTQYLPKDFSFFFSGVNLFDVFKNFNDVEPALLESLNQLQSTAQILYQFDLQKAVADLFNQPNDIVIFKNKDSVWGFDFVIAAPANIKAGDLEKLINIFLASRFPQRVKHILPDNTSVTEIKINPEAFVWQSDGNIRYFVDPKLKVAVAYNLTSDKLLVASGPELLKRYISAKDISVKNLAGKCGLDLHQGIILLNFKDWPVAGFYLPESLVGIGQEGAKGLTGCIL